MFFTKSKVVKFHTSPDISFMCLADNVLLVCFFSYLFFELIHICAGCIFYMLQFWGSLRRNTLTKITTDRVWLLLCVSSNRLYIEKHELQLLHLLLDVPAAESWNATPAMSAHGGGGIQTKLLSLARWLWFLMCLWLCLCLWLWFLTNQSHFR